jgi:WhiB family redox-sensing transcriptional regulator
MPVPKRQFRDVGPLNPINWASRAACSDMDTDLFYPEASLDERKKGVWNPADYEAARQVCLGCPVRPECYEYAMATEEEWGMWGGFTPEERKAMKKSGLEPDLRGMRSGSRKSLDSTTVASMLARMDYGKPSLGRSNSRRSTSR